eukprot:TRINITY_DN5108_c0_g1_i2.p2 TRINITY_DN5108_c0_g1~~TRINITY_DN5108_c0_g1_i2.p2  ORF type:complete len:138 (-),score=17.65 TRINITY_DN5108_c0_g1_i2:245-658(-)
MLPLGLVQVPAVPVTEAPHLTFLHQSLILVAMVVLLLLKQEDGTLLRQVFLPPHSSQRDSATAIASGTKSSAEWHLLCNGMRQHWNRIEDIAIALEERKQFCKDTLQYSTQHSGIAGKRSRDGWYTPADLPPTGRWL